MNNELTIILSGIALAIGLIFVFAFTLQKWLVVQRFSSAKDAPLDEKRRTNYSDLSEKIRSNSGIDFPIIQIKDVLSIPDSDDSIVLLDHMQTYQNVLRCNPDGSLDWVAEILGKSDDVYTSIAWDKQKLRASSWSGFSVILDIETGRILSSEFTK